MRLRYSGLMSSKLPVVLFVTAVVIASVVGSTFPANALIQRDYNYLNDKHVTARYGNTAVCGDHMCAPGEWNKLQQQLTSAQLGYQGGRNATSTTTPSMSGTMPSTATSPSVPISVCESIKNTLNGAGVSSATVAKVMSDLGCS